MLKGNVTLAHIRNSHISNPATWEVYTGYPNSEWLKIGQTCLWTKSIQRPHRTEEASLQKKAGLGTYIHSKTCHPIYQVPLITQSAGSLSYIWGTKLGTRTILSRPIKNGSEWKKKGQSEKYQNKIRQRKQEMRRKQKVHLFAHVANLLRTPPPSLLLNLKRMTRLAMSLCRCR